MTKSSKLAMLWAFDESLKNEGSKPYLQLMGVDEVGRGSLIGPVTAAAFCFLNPELTQSEQDRLRLLDDSKATHFTHPKRASLSVDLQAMGAWGIGEASREEVEQLNINQASLLACYRAIQALVTTFSSVHLKETLVVMDGRQPIPGLKNPQQAIVKADAKSASVAAASVIAKVHRDNLMLRYAEVYPQYDWANNMGYPTPTHLEALSRYGVTPYHRQTYKSVKAVLTENLLPL